MSDKHEAPRKAREEDEVVELLGESASAVTSQLSLEEQIAQLADLEIEDEVRKDPKEKHPDPSKP